MKKLIHRIKHRKGLPPSSRITSETVVQHREHVLAGGRRFKYPIQYARHKLVFNAITISVVAIIIALAVGWWQLYPEQNTSDFMYRVTKVIPVPVAMVDGQPVLYSDYLMMQISSVSYLVQIAKVNPKTDDGKRQIKFNKQKSMRNVIENVYAAKLAKGLGVSVSDNELQDTLKKLRQTSSGETSDLTNESVLSDYFSLSPEEYSYMVRNELLRQKVAFAMDKEALGAINSIDAALKTDPKADFKALAAAVSKTTGALVTSGASGWVPKTNMDGGLALESAKLKKLEISSVIKTSSIKGYGYDIVRLVDINTNQVSYEYIHVQLNAFTNSLEKIIAAGKVQKFIAVADLPK